MTTLHDLIEILSEIERKYSDKKIEVEIRDAEGFPTNQFNVMTDIVFGTGRVTVQFVPSDKS